MKSQNTRCLLLNADFSPLSVMDWQKAVGWSMRYEHNNKFGIDIIDFYKDDFIAGVNNKKYPIPAVARTKRYFKLTKQNVTFSRKNIFIRDEFTCQYCDKIFPYSELTYDHVIPKSCWNFNNGSPTNWTNIVTSCRLCNRKKGNRTPKQANMPIKNLPVAPNKSPQYLPISHYLSKIKSEIPEEWMLYLPEAYIN
jgi:5-methylcytosine-specific restriction endonuclease McrA